MNSSLHAWTVNTIAVIGASTVGRDIAHVAASNGFRTVLEDVSDLRLEKAVAWIVNASQRAVVDVSPAPQAPGAAMLNLLVAHTAEAAIRDADLIIETLPDEMEMQLEMFTILDKFAKPNAIFASTGLLSISDLAEMTFRADRCVGMRFGAQVAETKTVELIRGPKTSSATIAVCSDVCRRMRKDAVVIEDLRVTR